MAPRLIPLEVWAIEIYGDKAPCLNTLRRWAREGFITPPAEKHGRTYFVLPDAKYTPRKKVKIDIPAERVHGPREPSESATDLLKRMIEEASKRRKRAARND